MPPRHRVWCVLAYGVAGKTGRHGATDVGFQTVLTTNRLQQQPIRCMTPALTVF
ncbi:MAG: hypothetical protein ACYDBB_04395 [Armatimonadota bacterium]